MMMKVDVPLSVDLALSEKIAQEVRAKPKQCYKNAALGLLWVPHLVTARDAFYVEGVVGSVHGLPFDHAWLEWDGRIIDPTFTPTAFKKIRLPDRELAREIRAEELVAFSKGRTQVSWYRPVRRYTHAELYAHYIKARGWLPMTEKLGQYVHLHVMEQGGMKQASFKCELDADGEWDDQ